MQYLKTVVSNAFRNVAALSGMPLLKKSTKAPALLSCTISQLAQALQNAVAAGTPLSTLNRLLCCHRANGSLLRIQFARPQLVSLYTHPLRDSQSPLFVQKVPRLKLTIGRPTCTYVVHVLLHPSEILAYTGSWMPTVQVNSEGSKNEVFKGPLLDIPLAPGSSQFLCVSPFLHDSSRFNNELLQQLAQLYVPDLPNILHPFQDVKLRLGVRVDLREHSGVEDHYRYSLTVETPSLSLPDFHTACYQSQFHTHWGHRPAFTPKKLKSFMQSILVPYTAYHILKCAPRPWRLLERFTPNPYEDAQSYRVISSAATDFELFMDNGNNLYVDFDSATNLPCDTLSEESTRIVPLSQIIDSVASQLADSEPINSNDIAFPASLSYWAQRQRLLRSLQDYAATYQRSQFTC